MTKNKTLVLAAAVSTFISVFATPVGAGYWTDGALGDADSREQDLATVLITTEESALYGSATGLQEPELLAWCRAMGGYSSYEAQARAQAREREKWERQRTQVRSDQTALKLLNYHKGKVDGYRGPATKTAIRNFQRENGLPITGNLDASSRRLLDSGNAKRMPDQREKKRAERQQIMENQKVLQKHGYYSGKLDGLPGPATKAAIGDFRRAHNLGIGTRLDADSRKVLYSDKALPKSVKELGRNKNQISSDQQALADLGYYNGAVDGIGGSKTRAAIRKFKRDGGLDRGNARLNDRSRSALHEAHAENRWIKSANGDGVVLIIASQRQAGYRLRTANGDYIYEAGNAGKVLALVDKTLSKRGMQKVFIDVAKLSPKQVRSIKETLNLRPKSSVQLLESANLRNLVFSQSLNVTKVSPLTKHTTGYWQSTVEFSSSKTARFFIDVIGKTKELTSKFVDRLGAAFSGQPTKKTLGGAVNQIRKDLKKPGYIKRDGDLRTLLREEFGETIELMGIPTSTSVRVT